MRRPFPLAIGVPPFPREQLLKKSLDYTIIVLQLAMVLDQSRDNVFLLSMLLFRLGPGQPGWKFRSRFGFIDFLKPELRSQNSKFNGKANPRSHTHLTSGPRSALVKGYTLAAQIISPPIKKSQNGKHT